VAERTRNQTLVGYLARAGWSAENLGHHVNLLAASLRLADRVHVKSPRRWIEAMPPRDVPSIPRDPWPGLVCAALSRRLHEPVTLASLGWQQSASAIYVPADDGLTHVDSAVASLTEVVEADGMDRRHFLVVTGGALTTFAHDWLFDPDRIAAAVKGKRIDHAVVDDLERVADARRRLDDTLGGGAALLRSVREDLRLVIEILSNASYTEDVGKRLHAVAAEFARITGGLANDLDQQALGQRYYLSALRAAHASGDRGVGAHVLSWLSGQARHHDPRDAIRLAESAMTNRRELTPAVSARLHGTLAMAASLAGETKTADHAQARMFELTAVVDMATEPAWIYWWSQAEAHYHAGQSALGLNNPKRAEGHFRTMLSCLDPAFPRDRAMALPKLAMARVQLRELDGACRAAGEAATLARRLGSERVRTRLVEFRRAVQPHANAAPVKDFDTKYADLLHT